MPVVEGQVFLQVALVFGLIGLLGLVLRWTFRRDPRPPSLLPTRETPGDPGQASHPTAPPETRPQSSAPASPTAGSTSPPVAQDAPPTGSSPGKRSGKRKSKAKQPAARAEQPTAGTPGAAAASPSNSPSPSSGPRTAGGSTPAPSGAQQPSGRRDYGLLAVAADVATEEEAAKVRQTLTAAGIRNTNATGSDGRHLVLVFNDEVIRARRVAGGSQGAGGGTSGSGGSDR